jgi:tight adherence protein C
MPNPALLIAFFIFVMAGVVAAGYYLLLRPASSTAGNEDQSAAQVLTDNLRSLGGALPDAKSGGALRKRLIAAGYRAPEAVDLFNGLTYAVAALLALIVAAAVLISTGSFATAFVPAVCAAGFAYLLPKKVLDRLVSARMRRVSDGLPTALDLLVLSVEAGQALDQAIYDASREIRRAYPDLADEFLTMHLSLRAATSRAEVFREFGERSKAPELKKLANLLIDSDRFGTSLGPTLRSHARYLRIRRRQVAQEAARKVTVKLVFPIFFLIFPSVLLVTLGPAVLQIMTTLRPMMEK